MSQRMIKDSICRSDSINCLSWFEECFFYRLLVNCDDYGRFDGRPAILKGALFPLKEALTNKDIEKSLKSLVDAELIEVYEADGKPTIQVVTWNKHQIVRAKKSKYMANDETCKQMYADDNELEKPKKPKKKAEPKTPMGEVVITLPLNSGAEYEIYTTDVAEWSQLYPAVDVMQALRSMRGWLNSNKSKRKTQRGITSFITNWLQRDQDKGGTPGYVTAQQKVSPSYDSSMVDKLLNEKRSDLI